jgi:uncharacterized protein YjbJ (UPF0337 family)
MWQALHREKKHQGDVMPNEDELKGKLNQAKGNIKQGVGKMTGDERLREEGVADEAAGEVQEGVGTIKRKVGDAVKDVGDRIKD